MSLVDCVDVDGNIEQVDSSKLRWRPSAYGIVILNDRVLLAKQRGGYALPGGGVDLGEPLEAAVRREVQEETGALVQVGEMVGGTSNFFKHPDGGERPFVQSIVLYFKCTYESGELSTAGFNDYEKTVGEFPEWVPVANLRDIQIVTSFDWRPYVMKVAGT